MILKNIINANIFKRVSIVLCYDYIVRLYTHYIHIIYTLYTHYTYIERSGILRILECCFTIQHVIHSNTRIIKIVITVYAITLQGVSHVVLSMVWFNCICVWFSDSLNIREWFFGSYSQIITHNKRNHYFLYIKNTYIDVLFDSHWYGI